ncbi:DUF3558 domain-containing protein [Amycolatopsis alkalitolerans]|uniref:DUF3558 domain-containing protein n=2 Tax=Amycolatopsis alkalitolerans TaxID=2547244 RepID=A0A5C4M771_9PSEU|nr:DUF3558 domain-containing protein [Amycolatopsis alkalitolerans]
MIAVLAGCANEQPGNPSPVGGQSASATVPTSAAGSTGQDPGLASIKACSLLTDHEAATFKAQGAGQNQDTSASGATSVCRWTGRSASGASTNLSIAVRAAQGIESVNAEGGQLTEGKVNGRPAKQLVDSSGGYCMTSLAVTPGSRVDLGYVIVGASDATEACQTDNQIADIVEPKLPKYEG